MHPRIRLFVLICLLAISAAACGAATSDSRADDDGDGSESAGDPAAASTDAAFPVEIAHRYGETTIDERPERIVTVGLTDHDAFLALDVAPVGTTEWYGEHPHAVWPWAQDELGEATPELVGNAAELDFEQIADLDPDVIVGLYSALTQEQYETLSQIAPTVAQPDEHVDYGIPWQELTETAGRILGQRDEAQGLVDDLEERFEQVRGEHPEFDGAEAAIASPYEGIYVYSGDVANSRILAELGFDHPDEIAELVGEADGAELSLERVDLLDVDALVWLDAQPDQGPLAEPLYEQLDVHTQGREVLVDSASELGGAMSFSSVLSLRVVLDELAPRLEAAVDGDPDTEVPAP